MTRQQATETLIASLKNITEKEYGVNAITCDPIVVTWAHARLWALVGKRDSALAIEGVNATRKRLGKSQADHAPCAHSEEE